MTVIAWDGKVLAADKRAVGGGGIARATTKIERFGDTLLAITGNWDVAVELREWYKAGAVMEDFPEAARKDDGGTLIVISAKGIMSYAQGPYPMPIEHERCAFGSGRDFAEVAMHLGKSAAEAIELTALFQTDCGNGVDILTL